MIFCLFQAPSETRIPTFGSRIPKPGKFRFLSNPVRHFQSEEPTFSQTHNVKGATSAKFGSGISQPTIRPSICGSGYPNRKVKLETTQVIITQPCNETVILLKDQNSDDPPETTGETDDVVMENETNVANVKSSNEYDTVILVEKDKNLENVTYDVENEANVTIVTGNEEVTYSKSKSVNETNILNDCSVDDVNVTVVLDSNKVEATFIQNQGLHNTTVIARGITSSDVGQGVVINNTQKGVLKYFGEVKFNAGLWCGVELDNPVGKHDGCVKGVRYFTCRAGCGIMAPMDRVTIASEETKPCDSNFEMITAEENCSSGPYSLIGIETCRTNETYIHEPTEVITNRTIVKNPVADQGLPVNPESVKNRRLTHTIEYHNDEISSSDFVKSAVRADRRSLIIACSTNFNKDNTSETELDLKLSSSRNTSTPLSKERNKRKSADDSSTISTISPLNPEGLEFFGNATKKLATPINSPVETPSFLKQNSFELDESLGILTPDQMKEFTHYNINSKTPSSDDLKSLVASKLSDKTISNSRTPSSENLGSLPNDGFKQPKPLSSVSSEFTVQNSIVARPDSIDLKPVADVFNKPKIVELPSPNIVDQSTMDFSLGLIDEDMLASGTHFSSNLETTTNFDLPLDPINLDGKLEDLKTIPRCDQTPSPEDLPLDPIDTIDTKMDLLEPSSSNPSTDSDVKTDQSSKSTANTKTNSFITSITSITSLDTGYQGDGEMSRPASRGADHSPIAHKPSNPAVVNLHWQRAIVRRQDPMTDSDFFTESDADGHEEAVPRGDRRAQVIDGTLYGANAQAAAAAADIYINNHEEMDSSGIFTDLDTNPRTDDFSDGERNKEPIETIDDKSPSDVSTKTISENSQELREVVDPDATLVNQPAIEECIQDKTISSGEPLKSPTQSIASNPGSRKSPRTRTPLPKEESPNKKIKMPKRNVASKVKTMMETKGVDSVNQENRKPSRKTVNRWDAVMNKISKVEDDKSKMRLSQIKSKVSTGISGGTTSKRTDNVKSEDATKPKM